MRARWHVALLLPAVAMGCGRVSFDPVMAAPDADLDSAAEASLDAALRDSSADGAATDVRAGLVLELSFETSATMDGSGGGRDARCGGASCPTLDPSGVMGSAIRFTGGGEHLLVDDDGTFDLTGGFTIATWVRFETAIGRDCIFTKPVGGDFENSFALCADDGTPFLYLCGATCEYLRAESAPGTATWFHLAATHDGSTQRFFVDGVEIANRAGMVSFDAGPLVIGGDVDDTFGYPLEGLLDELRVYDRPLGDVELGVISTRP